MRRYWRDVVASICVAAAAALYGLWITDVVLTGTPGTRIVGGTILGLGIVASAFAVVPGFEGLLRGSKLYLAIASLLGLGALTAGVWTLVSANEAVLGVLLGVTVVLWVTATVRHVVLARTAGEHARTEHIPISADVEQAA